MVDVAAPMEEDHHDVKSRAVTSELSVGELQSPWRTGRDLKSRVVKRISTWWCPLSSVKLTVTVRLRVSLSRRGRLRLVLILAVC